MSQRKHLIHVKSNQTATGTSDPKAPLASDLSYGEIAINYLADKERMFIKNSNNEIVSFVSSKVIEENEEVIAQALAVENEERIEAENEINDTISELEQTVENNERVSAAAMADLDSRISEVTQTVEDNELVIAAALSEINDKIDNLIEITYSELVSLKNGNNLSKGTYYRITDYNTTTVQENTQSANHPFDVIVLALSNNTLSENAQAIQHAGDSYFTDCKLSAWELKYCIENDTDRFAWADPTQGKGVIFYMKDEWNNECPYDFKNIQFKRWAITKTNASSDDPFNNRYVGINNDGEIFPNGYDIPDDNDFKWLYTFSGQSASWDEENDSIIYPDDITRDTEIYDLSNVDMHGFYNENTDPVGCSNNIIKEYYGGRNFAVNTLTLNNIIFTGWFIDVETLPSNYEELYGDGIFEMMSVPFSNTFENECYNNTFGNNTYGNTFGNKCYNNSFGNYFQYNTFGNDFQYNTFGNDFQYNTFGNDCNSNTFGNSVNRNTFGNSCFSNTFGNSCFSNTFGNDCNSNTFGNYFQYNTFGNRCYNNSFGNSVNRNTFGNNAYVNTFGNNAYGNTFGNNAYGNTFGNDFQYNTFGNSVNRNTFGNDCNSNTFGNAVNHVTFSKDYTYYVIVENGNQYITLTSTKTTGPSNLLRNITMAQGVNNTTTNKSISHDSVNDTIKTTYQPENSVVKNV